jgi:hypothetical protein
MIKTLVEHPEGTKLIKIENGWKLQVTLEKNKWYKCKEYGNLVYYHSDENLNYGFTYGIKKWSSCLELDLDYTWVLATYDEVKDALIAETDKKGYKIGFTVKRDHFLFNKKTSIITGDDFLWTGKSLEMGGLSIYELGKWAEIISNSNEKILERIAIIEKELEQLKKELND